MAKILVADDERRMLDLMDRVFGKRGYDLEMFTDGASAIEAIEAGDHDLILTDLKMPGATGIDVLAAAKAKRPKVPVIIISGAAEPEDCARADALGVYMMLHKPVDLAYLLTIIESALDEGRAQGGAGSEGGGGTAGGGGAPGSEGPGGSAPAGPAPAAGGPAPGPTPGPDGGGAGGGAKGGNGGSHPQAPLVRVTDREPCLANLIAYCLRKQGFRVTTGASHGTAAAAVVGLAGAIGAVRRDAPDAVIIALYPQGSTEDAVAALEGGADVALERPFDPDILFAHVRAAVRRRESAAPPGGEDRPITRSRLVAAHN